MSQNDWRKLESELVDIFRREGWDLDQVSNTGDKIGQHSNWQEVVVNLTLLAQELARRGVL